MSRKGWRAGLVHSYLPTSWRTTARLLTAGLLTAGLLTVHINEATNPAQDTQEQTGYLD